TGMPRRPFGSLRGVEADDPLDDALIVATIPADVAGEPEGIVEESGADELLRIGGAGPGVDHRPVIAKDALVDPARHRVDFAVLDGHLGHGPHDERVGPDDLAVVSVDVDALHPAGGGVERRD